MRGEGWRRVYLCVHHIGINALEAICSSQGKEKPDSLPVARSQSLQLWSKDTEAKTVFVAAAPKHKPVMGSVCSDLQANSYQWSPSSALQWK